MFKYVCSMIFFLYPFTFILSSYRLFDDHLIQSFHHILFTRNLFIVNCDPIVEARLNLLHFQFAIDTNDMELGSDLLNQINACFTNNINPIEIILLPNQIYCTFVDPWIIANEMKLMECLLQQTTIQRDYSNGFERLDNVESVLLKHRQYNFESKQLSIFQQFEMLLEIFWLTDRFDVCLHWCEIGLNESMRIRREHKAKNLPISKEFACHVQFLTIYLQELLQRNHQGECLHLFFRVFIGSDTHGHHSQFKWNKKPPF